MYTYIPISPLSCVSLPPSLSHPSRWSQSTELIPLCYAAASHQLSSLHLVVCICQCKRPFEPETSNSAMESKKLTSGVSDRMLVPEQVSFHCFYAVMLHLRFCLGEKCCGQRKKKHVNHSFKPQVFQIEGDLVLLLFTLLRFADNCSFYKLKVCGNPELSNDGQHFLAIKYFLIKACTFFLDIMLLHT